MRCNLSYSDYIHDNCRIGRTERFNMYCNVLLKPDNFYNLSAICEDMGGHLSWFDTMQELGALHGRLWEYATWQLNRYVYTGTVVTGVKC